MKEAQYDLLTEAAEASLPMTVSGAERINWLRAYQTVGWVQASIPPLLPGPRGTMVQPPATLFPLR